MTYMRKDQMEKIQVQKRDGSIESFDPSKWELQIKKVCGDIEGVSSFTIAATSQAQFKKFMTTEELDDIALRSMVNLIDVDTNPIGHTNYQYVAGRQRISMLRKKVYGSYTVPRLYDHVVKQVAAKLYTPELLTWYSEEEWDFMDANIVDHTKDETYTYAQVEQFVDKYLVRNRFTNTIVETPQVRYIIAAATAMHAEGADRMTWIKDAYECTSNGEYTLATPVAAGLGTATKQFSSCVTISVDDTLDSIYESGRAMAKYAGKRAGIGLEIGRIRGINSAIRGGEIVHTGVVPFVKKWEKDLRSVSQGGVRTGSATVFFPIWHYDMESLVVLKNNQGTEETRARQLDYCVQLAAMFWERLRDGKNITLFSPDEAEGLYDLYFKNIAEFEKRYCELELDPTIRKKTITADEAMRTLVATERSGTGRIYTCNVDNIQFQGSYDPEEDTVTQSNLCLEVLIPTEPFGEINSDEGLIGLCTLGSISWGKFKTPEQMRPAVRTLYRTLHNLLQYQDFLVPQSRKHNEMYEPLGIGVTDLAHWHAQRGFVYGQPEALAEVKNFMEHQYFYMMEMNVELAEQKGPCSRSHATRYGKGQFIFELRHPGVNELTDFTPNPNLNYEGLRGRMIKYGVRNSVTGAIAPVESSSLLIHSTNGVALPKSLIINKGSRSSNIVQVVPEYELYKDNYQKLLMWEQDSPRGYLKTVATLQVYIDQGISADTFYNPKEIINPTSGAIEFKIDVNEYMTDSVDFMNWGGKTSYYLLINRQRVIDRLKSSNVDAAPPVLDAEDYCESCTL